MEKFPRRVPQIPKEKQIKYISISDSIKYVLTYCKIYAILEWINSSYIIFCILLLLLPILSSLTIGSICGDIVVSFSPGHGMLDIESPYANYLNIAVMSMVVLLFTYLYVKRRRENREVYLKFATIFWLGNLSMFVYGIPSVIPQSFYIYPYIEHIRWMAEKDGDLSFLLVAPFLYIGFYLIISFFDFWIPVILMIILSFCRNRVIKSVILAIYFIAMLLFIFFAELNRTSIVLPKSLLLALIIYPISRYIDRKSSC